MRVAYIAKDGKEFNNILDCELYEKECAARERAAMLKAVVGLDNTIWGLYNKKEDSTIPAGCEFIWLNSTIEGFLREAEDINTAEERVLKLISDTDYEEEILSKINMTKIKEAATIRRDFETALKNVKRGADLASVLSYSFSEKDISILAMLHKRNKYRSKIESMLTAANFHEESSNFHCKKYEEYIT